MMVILDLVMNHFGPDGAWIHHAAPDFFDPDRHTPGRGDRFLASAGLQFLDRLRDALAAGLWLRRVPAGRGAPDHRAGSAEFMKDLAAEIATLTPRRHLITEDERNIPDLREVGYDASWNDDFHHAVHVALTGESDSYYASFAVDPIADLTLALSRGHIERGQPREGLDHPRGAPCGHLPPTAFVNAIQTHDQIGNRALGERLLTLARPEAVRVAYALLLVAPYVPMVFMGEERGETAPFQFFADYSGDLGEAVRKAAHPSFRASPAWRRRAGPDRPRDMERSRLGGATMPTPATG